MRSYQPLSYNFLETLQGASQLQVMVMTAQTIELNVAIHDPLSLGGSDIHDERSSSHTTDSAILELRQRLLLGAQGWFQTVSQILSQWFCVSG